MLNNITLDTLNLMWHVGILMIAIFEIMWLWTEMDIDFLYLQAEFEIIY